MAAVGAIQLGAPTVLTASGVVCGGTAMARTYDGSQGATAQSTRAETTALRGGLIGFFCNSTTGGTVAFSQGTASGGTAITGTITPTAGTWYPLQVESATGIYATIANTLNITCSVV
jgi:hypothetical protein